MFLKSAIRSGLAIGLALLSWNRSEAADPEITSNYRSGISLSFGGTAGKDYVEEYFYHDRKVWDSKTVYIKATTPISMTLNEFASPPEGNIRFRVDRDLNYDVNWHDSKYHPQYSAPIRFEDLRYEDGTAVVGTTGAKPGIPQNEQTRNSFYWRGMLDSSGEEWHSITVARELTSHAKDSEYNVTDGKLFVFVVNPKAPCLSVSVSGDAQFYTTPPKFYFLPQIHSQTTYLSPRKGDVAVRLRDLDGGKISYRITQKDKEPGAFTNSESSDITLADSQFSAGESILEYYSSDPKHTASRRIIKNPPFPSEGERHGDLLWGDGPLLENFRRNVRTDPDFKSAWAGLKKRAIPKKAAPGWTNDGSRKIQTNILTHALIAHEDGLNARSADGGTYANHAKELLLANLTRIDPIGLEQHQNFASIPSREIKDRGYYTVGSRGRLLDLPFAYDLLIGTFRSDRNPDGITPIEDLFIRDSMARWIMFTLTEIGGYNPHVPGMWGRCRFIASQVMALAMPSYSTPYFGTSGVDGNHTVYRDLPFPSKGYTWKDIFIDESNDTPGYPDPKFTADFDGQWMGPGAVAANSNVAVGQGAWGDRIPYSELRLCGWPFGTLAMMAALHTGKTYPNFFTGIDRLKIGDLYGGKKLSKEDDSKLGPIMGNFPYTDNALYPRNTGAHVAWARSNPKIFGDYFKYGSPYIFIWFDPTLKNGDASRPQSPSPAQ